MGWEPDPATFAVLGDVVQGMLVAIHAFTDPGDGVIVQGPIYPPFLTSVTGLGRRVVDNRLIDACGAAALDLEVCAGSRAIPAPGSCCAATRTILQGACCAATNSRPSPRLPSGVTWW